MENDRFAEYKRLCREFQGKIQTWTRMAPGLKDVQERLREVRGYSDYQVETPIVYNRALDDIGPEAQPRWILIADNPGKSEQKKANRRYLIGQSGRLAEGFFRRNLDSDFRSDVLVINKTPIHTPKTADLALLRRLDESGIAGRLLEETQVWMAGFAFRLHRTLQIPLWISGRSELRNSGVFGPWFREFSLLYREKPAALLDEVLVFSHFSMNQFAIEMARKRNPALPIEEELQRIGIENRKAVFGF